MYRGWYGWARHFLLFVVRDIDVDPITVSIFIVIAPVVEDAGGNQRPIWYTLSRDTSVEKSIKSTFHPHLERVLTNKAPARVESPLCPGLSDGDDELSILRGFRGLSLEL